jgi:NTP pyrophosphatase (non-canonical NTP hydrolase)
MEYNNQIYLKALSTYGSEAQLNMVIEECAELIQAINKMRRGRLGIKFVIEEMVDVQIMLEQFMLFYPAEIWEELKDQKILRLAKKLKDEVEDGTVGDAV